MNKILRISLTDLCNYDCVFCHNEGLIKGQTVPQINEKEIEILTRAIVRAEFTKIILTGGEPLRHPQIASIINTVYENKGDIQLNLTTNLVLGNERLIKEITPKVDQFNVNFQSNNILQFKTMTKRNKIKKVKENIDLLKNYNAKRISLNYVYTNSNADALIPIVGYAMKNTLELKVLELIKDEINSSLYLPIISAKQLLEEDGFSLEKTIKSEERYVKNNTIVRVISSYCNDKNLSQCKSHNEFRISPNFELNTCMKSNNNFSLASAVKEGNIEKLSNMFSSFCISENKNCLCR